MAHRLEHVIDRVADLVLAQLGLTALGGHHAGLTLEAVDGVVVKGFFALGEAIAPCALVTQLGRASHPRVVAGQAGLLIHGFAAERFAFVGLRDFLRFAHVERAHGLDTVGDDLVDANLALGVQPRRHLAAVQVRNEDEEQRQQE